MFATIKERYKNLPAFLRGILSFLIGLIPAAIIYSYIIEDKETERELVLKNHDTAQASLKKSQETIKNLPELEQKMKFTTEQLEKSKEFLPDNYDMESLVEKASRIAKELDVTFDHFEPKQEKMIEGVYPYFEQRISLDLSGNYAQLATFYDRLANIEPNIYLKSVNLGRQAAVNRPGFEKETPYDKARTLRKDQKLLSKSEIAIYRSAKDSEIRKEVKDPTKVVPAVKNPDAKDPTSAPKSEPNK